MPDIAIVGNHALQRKEENYETTYNLRRIPLRLADTHIRIYCSVLRQLRPWNIDRYILVLPAVVGGEKYKP